MRGREEKKGRQKKRRQEKGRGVGLSSAGHSYLDVVL